jgi:hypothetical protein
VPPRAICQGGLLLGSKWMLLSVSSVWETPLQDGCRAINKMEYSLVVSGHVVVSLQHMCVTFERPYYA